MGIYDTLFGGNPQDSELDLNDPRIAEILASQRQMPPGQQMPQDGVLNQAQGPGILDSLGIKTDNFGKRLTNGLMAAGSNNPAQTLLELQKADSARAAANKPKITPLANGSFSLIQLPDGTSKVVPNEDIQKYNRQLELDKIDRFKAQTDYKGDNQVSVANRTTAGKDQINNAGNSTQTEFNANELNTIAQSLLKGPSDTLFGQSVDPTGNVGILPKSLRDIVAKEGAALQDRAEKVIQGSLRATLGAQFTEKEGTRFLERAYNPKQTPAENAERLTRMATELKAIQSDKDNAVAYMKEHGTLDGFKPGGAPNAPGAGGPVKITGDDDYAKLPSGTQFIGPDGKTRKKP